MTGFSLLTLMQGGTLLVMLGLINVIIGGILFFLKPLAAKYLIKIAAGLVIIGLACLALVAAIGGWGMFNA